MSHVDEGVLHAYLDGGLSALDAVRVERHVADCGPCRQRLDQARALIQRAARLLEWASPPADRAAPPLADLRLAPWGAPRWRVPVAWAATIVIALGAGIYGGAQLWNADEKEADGFASSERRAAPITVLATNDSTPRRDANSAVTQPAAPAEAERAGAGAVANETTAALNRIAAAPTAKAQADTAQSPVVIDGLALGARRETPPAPAAAQPTQLAPAPTRDTTAGRIALRGAAPLSETTVTTAGVDDRAARYRAADAPVWPQIRADSARVLLGTAPVSIPDLPVTAIRTLNGVVAVEQVMPPGRVIKLLQRRAQADEEQVRTLSDLLARYVSGLRVEISGPMPPDSLSKLLERAREMP